MIEKIEEIHDKINKLERQLFLIGDKVDGINSTLISYIENRENEAKEGDKIVKNIESQLSLFPEMISNGNLDLSGIKDITSSVNGISERLKNIKNLYGKNYNKQ